MWSKAYPVRRTNLKHLFPVFVLTLTLLLAGSVQAKQFATIERINVTTIGQQAGGGQRPVTNNDGRFVAFWSDSAIIVPGDSNNTADIFVRDRQNGQIRIASVASGGTTQANAISYVETDMSSGGNLVVFASDASNLVSGDTNNVTDVFVYDVGVNQTARVSLGNSATQANGRSTRPVISGNGILVAFRSEATNLVANDSNAQADIFVYDRSVNQVAQVNLSSSGVQSNLEDANSLFAINEDGKYVAFESRGTNLVTDDTNGAADIFIRDRASGKTIRISVSSAGKQGNGASIFPAISSTGRYVAFASAAPNLVSDDSNGASDVFLHDRDTDNDGVYDEAGAISTVRVSVSSGGAQGNNSSTTPSISGDGRYVTFWSSATNLVSGDTNGVGDIFVRDVQLGITTRVSVGRNGEQANGYSAFVSSISGDGRFVAFESGATNLVSGDTNNAADIFLAQAGPNAPTNLVAEGVSSNQINLTWKDNATDEIRYIVERSSNGGSSWTVIASNLAANTKTYSDTTLSTCVDYTYRVFAENNVTKSSPSNLAVASTLGCPPGDFVLSDPAPDSYVINPANLMALTWTTSTEADTFDVKLERTVGVVEVLLETTVDAADACTDDLCSYALDGTIQAELTNGVYAWEVIADNEIGTTEATNSPAPFTVDDTLPPRGYTLLAPDADTLIRDVNQFKEFTWDINPDAATYNFLLLKGSNNPLVRDLGEVRNLTGLTPADDADALICDGTVCALEVDDTLAGELTTGTYVWTSIAVSPGGGETEATNAPYLFSVNTGDISLLVNSGMESDTNNDKVPDSWTPSNLTKDKQKCNTDTKTVANTGSCAFEFKGGTAESSALKQKPDVSSYGLVNGDTLLLAGYFSGKNTPASVGVIQLKVKYEDSGLSTDKLKLTAAAGTYTYDDLTGQLVIDGGVKNVQVSISYKGTTGKLLVDDVTLLLAGTDELRSSIVGRSDEPGTGAGLIPLPENPDSGLGNRGEESSLGGRQ